MVGRIIRCTSVAMMKFQAGEDKHNIMTTSMKKELIYEIFEQGNIVSENNFHSQSLYFDSSNRFLVFGGNIRNLSFKDPEQVIYRPTIYICDLEKFIRNS